MAAAAQTDDLEVAFRRTDDGSVLRLDGPDGRFALRSDDGAFWTASLRDEYGAEATLDGADAHLETDRVRADGAVELVLRWVDEPVDLHASTGTATTTLRGRMEPGDPTVYWTAAVTVEGVTATLAAFSLPAVDDVRRPDRDRAGDHLVLPEGWGLDVEDPFETPSRASLEAARYPGASCTMQFLALLNGDDGLYVAAHDPGGRPKSVTAVPDAAAGDLRVGIEHHPPGVTEPTGTFALPYEVATGTVAGDWYDAAQRYRRWALDAATWTRDGPLAAREDVPERVRDRAVWWLLAPRVTDHDRDRALLDRLGAAFPVPTGVHWYTWHDGPFDVDYPDYFPPRKGWVETVETLASAGMTAMPYVNARIADPNSRAWRERDLADGAARGASARLDPRDRPLRYETYDDQRMVAMCPATSTWRDAVLDVVERLDADTPARAVYLDQLAAYAPPLCHAEDHDHPTGGGTYGVEGYRALLSAVRERTDLAVTTENSAEPYLDLVDGHLLWNSARTDLVPLFSAVYGDHALAFGRQFFEVDLEHDGAFRSKLAQSLVFGAQPGWVHHRVAERLLEGPHDAERRYLRGAVESLADIGGVHVGRRLRDPGVRGAPTRSLEWEMYRHGRWEVELPAVLAGLWRPDEGSGPRTVASLLVTNWTETDEAVTIALPTDQVSPGAVASVRTRGDAAVDVQPRDGGADGPIGQDGDLHLRVPVCETAVLELCGPGDE